MKQWKNAALLIASLLSLAACVRPVTDGATSVTEITRQEELALRAAGLTWNDAFTTLNVDAMIALYADDAMLMPQTATAARGRAEIRKYLVGYFAKLRDAPYSFLIPAGPEVRVSGDLGIRWGSYEIRDQSGVAQDTGKWLQAWRKVGGKWLIMLEIPNSDQLPLFPPDPPVATP